MDNRPHEEKGSLNPKRIMHFQLIFGVILLVWGAAITVYDQRVSENISVYLIMSLTVSMMLYFTPAQALITYGALQVALLFLMPLFQSNASDGYGTRVNLTVMTLMCVFICIYRYSTGRKNYLYQQIIIDKNSHLEYIANRDTLTGLWNRRFLEKDAEKQFKRCVHNRVPVTFMMIDIDSFKEYNDEYGHHQGDECLRRLAWRISSERDSEREFLVRYAVDEFLYIGFGTDRAPRISLTDCVARADQALYDAKNQGKGRVCVFE